MSPFDVVGSFYENLCCGLEPKKCSIRTCELLWNPELLSCILYGITNCFCVQSTQIPPIVKRIFTLTKNSLEKNFDILSRLEFNICLFLCLTDEEKMFKEVKCYDRDDETAEMWTRVHIPLSDFSLNHYLTSLLKI